MDRYQLSREHIEGISLLSDQNWEYASSFFVYRQLRRHQFLVQKDEKVLYKYLIIKGLSKTYGIDAEGRELYFNLHLKITGQVILMHSSMTPATLYIDCIEDCKFFGISLRDWEKLCRNLPAMSDFFRIKAHFGYIALQERIFSLLTQTAQQRYD